ncbi:hypothetical protein [Methylorubrum sp. SB2]|uniref:hypothetical protein n=1 Tax=Methylorubrum subtropicum TaxID=3138812 RepID=UPI00313B7890
MRSSLPRTGRLVLAAGLVSLLAACNTAGRTGQYASLEGYTPDPTLKTASKSNLTGRVRNACAIVQSRLQKVEQSTLEAPCGCYADRTLASLDKDEVASYRATGYFNDTATAKALNALDSCKLPRPV